MYKFVVRESYLEYKDIREVIIGVKCLETGLILPHPLNNYISTRYSSSKYSLNTQRLIGNIVCQFLNFLMIHTQSKEEYFNLKKDGLHSLEIEHGIKFLNYKKKLGLSTNYINLLVYYLSDFYFYLKDLNIIKFNIENELKDKNISRTNLFGIVGLRREEKTRSIKLKDFGENKYYLISLFINISQNIAPEITLGICIQFFGGLRKGEVVNIMKNDISISKYGSIKVSINNNSEKLFKNKKDLKDESVKRVNYLQQNLREQEILNFPLVKEVFLEHMKYIDKFKASKDGVMFFNKDGNPMSGQVYKNRFNKVKKHFLKELLNQQKYEDYNLLANSLWSTHIGRGIFTNFLIDMGLSEVQVAILRGDRSTYSNRDYYDVVTSKKLIKEHLPKIESYLENKFKG